MAYQVADINNGAFGEVFQSYEAALRDYKECVKEGAEINTKWGDLSASDAMEKARSFFFIVEVD